MMCFMLKIYMGLGLCAVFVHGDYDHDILNTMERFAREGYWFNSLFQPTGATPLGSGKGALVFPALNMIDFSDVAMKFSNKVDETNREYRMYSYLKAIEYGDKKSDVEQYGISPIYYFNLLQKYKYITVLSLFECNLIQMKSKLKERKMEFEPIDYLILFRDFVRQIKYVHSCGIRHNSICPTNIMLRKGRSFLIDFRMGSKINFHFSGAILNYASRRNHQKLKGDPFDDWESFLYTMAYILDIKLTWFAKTDGRNAGEMEISGKEIGNLKRDTTDTIEKIKEHFKQLEGNPELSDRKKHGFKQLKVVMLEFANEAFANEKLRKNVKFPDYDKFETLITGKIDIVKEPKNEPALFSWLKEKQREEAIDDLDKNKPATAKQIELPKKKIFEEKDYAEVDPQFFRNRSDEMIEAAKEHVRASNDPRAKEARALLERCSQESKRNN